MKFLRKLFNLEKSLKKNLAKVEILSKEESLIKKNDESKKDFISRLKFERISLNSMKREKLISIITVFTTILIVFASILTFAISRLNESIKLVKVNEELVKEYILTSKDFSTILFNLLIIIIVVIIAIIVYDLFIEERNREIQIKIELIELKLEELEKEEKIEKSNENKSNKKTQK
ncbi:hypothetical protein LIZ77_07250 [Clostridium perfringens]|uniref:hypothetical protein n=1 Tax=Clostridium perfringens TaxID=1502 RepID=UPI00224794D4|nr:hypothetical protein [Clostridium perfringens]MCX0370572.1 hypothetical protein [Clostridium perfringens]